MIDPKKVAEEQRRLESHRPMLKFLREVSGWKIKSKGERRAARDIKRKKELF